MNKQLYKYINDIPDYGSYIHYEINKGGRWIALYEKNDENIIVLDTKDGLYFAYQKGGGSVSINPYKQLELIPKEVITHLSSLL